MKPQPNEIQSISNLDSSQVSEFSIKDTAIPFVIDMLSSRLYVDPIMAMVRETITNALDAQGLEPIRVTLDHSQPDLCIYAVSDSGPGMDRDCVTNILTKLGESTKSHDNTAHGGYGIGFLSIFAAAQQATIETVSAGIKYYYLLCRNEQGVPILNLVDQCPADGQVGTKITVALDERRDKELDKAIDWFANLTKASILYYEINQSGYKQLVPFDKTSFEGAGYELRDLCWTHANGRGRDGLDVPIDTQGACLIVRIGDIPYRLSREQILDVTRLAKRLVETDGELTLINVLSESTVKFAATTTKLSKLTISPHLPHLFLALNIGIGQLDLPGSREEILCNERNNQLIATALIESIRHLQAAYRQRFLEPEGIALLVKVRVVQAFRLESFNYAGVQYHLTDLWTNFCYSRLEKGNLNREISHLYHYLSAFNPEPVVVLINLRQRKQASTIVDLVRANPALYNYLHRIKEFRFIRYETEAEYRADLERHPIVALALQGAPVLVDPGPTPRTPLSEEAAQREKERRAKVRSHNYLNKNPVRRLESLQALGVYRRTHPHAPMLLADIAGKDALFSPSPDVVLLPQLESKVVYLEVSRVNGMTDFDLLVFAEICAERHWDTHVHFVPADTLNVVKNIYPREQVIKIEDWIDEMTYRWASERLPLIQRIGFFPGLNIREPDGTADWMEAVILNRSRQIAIKIDQLVKDADVAKIAQPEQITDFQTYLRDFQFWRLIVESGYPLRLFRTILLFETAVKDGQIAFVLDRDLHRTVADLLAPVLKQIPLFAFIKISLDQVPIDQFLLSVKLLVEKYDPHS